jgi:hypothetical protein
VKVASEPEALLAVLRNSAYHFKRIGLEARPLSQWLFSALAEAKLPVVLLTNFPKNRWREGLRVVRGVDRNVSVKAAHRADRSQSIDDTIVQ